MNLERAIIKRLEDAGKEGYFVGGCVRDELLGGNPMDLDIATNATYAEAREILKGLAELEEVGKQFGVLLVGGVEVAQFRGETYETNGKPTITDATMLEDSARRDFTINSMYKTLRGEIIDFHNGKKDIKEKVIRAVGNPETRFKEDSSRVIRAFYLASKLGFTIEENTLKAMQLYKNEVLNVVPNELKGKLVLKAIKGGNFARFVDLIMKADMMDAFIPELAHLNNLPQNPTYHVYSNSAWEHVVDVVKSAEKIKPKDVSFILGALLHDVAKGLDGVRGVNPKGFVNDLNHEAVGAPIAKKIILRLGLGLNVAREVEYLVEHHGWRFNGGLAGVKDKTIIKQMKKLTKFSDTKEEFILNIKRLIEFTYCDAHSFKPELQNEVKETMKFVASKLPTLIKDTAFYRSELPLNGSEIMKINPKLNGKLIGYTLEKLLHDNVKDKEKAILVVQRLTPQKLENFMNNK